jgi:hypothetical protein
MQTQNILPVSTSSQNQSLMETNQARSILHMESNIPLIRMYRLFESVLRGIAWRAFWIPNKLGLARITVEEFEKMREREFKRKASWIEVISSAYCVEAKTIHLSEFQICSLCTNSSDIFVHPNGVCAACWLDSMEPQMKCGFRCSRNWKKEWLYLFSVILCPLRNWLTARLMETPKEEG